MIGILVILIISYLLLRFFAKENLLVLGVLPIGKRLKQFGIGFLLAGSLCAIMQILDAGFKGAQYQLNPQINIQRVFSAFFWDFKSVLTEELIFRGAILFLLIKRFDVQKAILISAAVFGVYHWFSVNVLGSLISLALIFLGTGLMGYVWALAYAKTESIMLPLGFHLGWNFVVNTIFSKGPLGNLVLISSGGVQLSDWWSLFVYLIPMIGGPLVLFLFMKYFVPAENKQFQLSDIREEVD